MLNKKGAHMKQISWEELYKSAEGAMQGGGGRTISPFAKGGYVSTAILTDKGNIYTGVNLKLECGLDVCSERYAAYKMFEANKGEVITKLVCLYKDKGPSVPCGACKEYLMQLDKASGEMDILQSLNPLKTVKLKDTMPDWWGNYRYETK